jgi:hypothetical protein
MDPDVLTVDVVDESRNFIYFNGAVFITLPRTEEQNKVLLVFGEKLCVRFGTDRPFVTPQTPLPNEGARSTFSLYLRTVPAASYLPQTLRNVGE